MSSSLGSREAKAGEGDDGGSDGQGIGGGVYNLGTFTFDVMTIIVHNHASTRNDDSLRRLHDLFVRAKEGTRLRFRFF